MTARDAGGLALGLGAAALGAALFARLGVPAAALTGSAAAVTLAGLAGLRVAVPVWLRNGCFVLLGANIGTAVTPEMLRSAVTWPISIAVLAMSLVAGMVLNRALLERVFGIDRVTAALCAAPGHLSFVLAMAADGAGKVQSVALIQSIRVLVLTLAVPPLIAGAFGATGLQILPPSLMRADHAALVTGGALMLGMLFARMRVPAGYLLGAMVVSMLGHATDATPGRLPAPAVIGALVVMGTLIGSRFSGVRLAALRRLALAGLAVTVVTVSLGVLAALVVMPITGQGAALLFVAFAPGGVEAMAAIAIAQGLDPAFVAAHHIARLLLLSVLIPLLVPRAPL